MRTLYCKARVRSAFTTPRVDALTSFDTKHYIFIREPARGIPTFYRNASSYSKGKAEKGLGKFVFQGKSGEAKENGTAKIRAICLQLIPSWLRGMASRSETGWLIIRGT